LCAFKSNCYAFKSNWFYSFLVKVQEGKKPCPPPLAGDGAEKERENCLPVSSQMIKLIESNNSNLTFKEGEKVR